MEHRVENARELPLLDETDDPRYTSVYRGEMTQIVNRTTVGAAQEGSSASARLRSIGEPILDCD
jgi:hypothetical protein